MFLQHYNNYYYYDYKNNNNTIYIYNLPQTIEIVQKIKKDNIKSMYR